MILFTSTWVEHSRLLGWSRLGKITSTWVDKPIIYLYPTYSWSNGFVENPLSYYQEPKRVMELRRYAAPYLFYFFTTRFHGKAILGL